MKLIHLCPDQNSPINRNGNFHEEHTYLRNALWGLTARTNCKVRGTEAESQILDLDGRYISHQNLYTEIKATPLSQHH